MRRTTMCLGCGQAIVWRLTMAGHWTPDNPDGSTHWASCRQREMFAARLKRAGQGEGMQLNLMELQPEDVKSAPS